MPVTLVYHRFSVDTYELRELWIVNLEEDCLEVHRDPTPDGEYRDFTILRRGQEVEIAA